MFGSSECLRALLSRSLSSNPALAHKQHLMVRSFNFGLISGHSFRGSRYYYHHTKIVVTASVGFMWIWPIFTILGRSVGTCQLVSTQGSLDENEVMDKMLNQILCAIESDDSSTEEICAKHVDKLCRKGNLSAASRLLQFLRNRSIFLSPKVHNVLLDAAGEANDISTVSQVFKELVLSHGILNSDSYLSLARAFMTIDDCALLFKLVREISNLSFPRNTAITNRIIYAFTMSRQVDKAFLIFDHMKDFKCNPDVITYNIVLESLGRVGLVDKMLHVFSSMKESNVVPDVISYNTLINNLRKVGRLNACVLFLKEMLERGLQPDLRTYTALIDSFGRSGNIEECLRLFDEMKKKRICPSIYVYRSLISNSKKVGKLDLALNLSEEMNSCLANLVSPKDFKRKKG